jgi:hypothetical protein
MHARRKPVRSPQRQTVSAASEPAEAALPATVPIDPRRAALLDSGELIVGSRLGLEAWYPDGRGPRLISAGAAYHPRRFGRDHVLVLRPVAGFDARDGAVLDLIALPTGERRPVVELPAFRCADQPDSSQPNPRGLDVEDPADFEVHPQERVACLALMDSASKSATVRVRARIDLAPARVQRWLVLGEDTCVPPDGVEAGDPAADGTCWGIARPENPALDPAAFPFTFDEEHVRMPAAPRGGAKLQLRGYQLEQPSPSGRWLLLTGDYVERDTTYRRLVLLDRVNGKLYPLSSHAGGWPAPLTASGSKLKTPIKEAELIASGADVRWLGESNPNELLLLDGLLVRPGEPTFALSEGEVAR